MPPLPLQMEDHRMSIIDNIRTKNVVVQTDQGQVFINEDFTIENHNPISGFVKITDNSDKRIYWFNFNAISWIGPRQ